MKRKKYFKLNMVDRVQDVAVVESIDELNKLIIGANKPQYTKPLYD